MRKVFCGLLFAFFACLLVSCQNTGENTTPILIRGFVSLDSSIENTYLPYEKEDCHASIRVMNKTSDTIIGQTDLKGIETFPIMYVIRKPFYEAYTEYWDEYELQAFVYENSDDSGVVLKGSVSLDLNNYNYEEDIVVK